MSRADDQFVMKADARRAARRRGLTPPPPCYTVWLRSGHRSRLATKDAVHGVEATK